MCGKRKIQSGHCACIDCVLISTRRSRNMRYKNGVGILRSEYVSYGLCAICGGVVVEGKKLCAKHYEIAVGSVQRLNAARDNSGHIWRGQNNLIGANV